MRFICLGYADQARFREVPSEEMEAMMEECFAYDDELRRGGHFLGGEALQGGESAVTLRFRQGKVVVTDGPFAETKELLGGILILEARDLNHAISLMSKHPGVRFGPFEIRPADEEINALVAARDGGGSTVDRLMHATDPRRRTMKVMLSQAMPEPDAGGVGDRDPAALHDG